MQVSVGYFLSDIGMIMWFYPSLGGMEYVSAFYGKLNPIEKKKKKLYLLLLNSFYADQHQDYELGEDDVETVFN